MSTRLAVNVGLLYC